MDSLGVKSFEEIMQEKRQKRAALVNTSNKDTQKLTTTESKHTDNATTNSLIGVRKTERASPKKYKFTPIVFDLDSKRDEKMSAGSNEQRKWKSSESLVNPGLTGVEGSRQLSVSKAGDADPGGSASVTAISVTIQQSVPLKSDLTTEAAVTVTKSPSDKSDLRITPVIKRQTSSSNPSPDVNKKRRTSVDSRWHI